VSLQMHRVETPIGHIPILRCPSCFFNPTWLTGHCNGGEHIEIVGIKHFIYMVVYKYTFLVYHLDGSVFGFHLHGSVFSKGPLSVTMLQ
jgi:hypothetical protein